MALMLACDGLLFGALAFAGRPLLYIALWIVPFVTLVSLAGRVRAIFERAGLPAGEGRSCNARTIVERSWQTFLFGPHVRFIFISNVTVRTDAVSLPARSRIGNSRSGCCCLRASVHGIWGGLRDVSER
ncbi:hypothetical protein LGN30_01235 [Burkholderia seminalis]|uniref:hypothetical protein n=1 Tax=Burkholderia seminalis TaxID=488731 RepID=UPI00069D6383|nr:hypothetical protein [Burkholderia seminalis]MCA8421806.1 hypothetical protein [Burkholderia seminalis]